MIFCVEDDSSIRDLMIYTLNTAGFEAEGFAEGESMFEALMTKKPQLIMLDIMLPGEDGITTVSYTHLDVYKRQAIPLAASAPKYSSPFAEPANPMS